MSAPIEAGTASATVALGPILYSVVSVAMTGAAWAIWMLLTQRIKDVLHKIEEQEEQIEHLEKSLNIPMLQRDLSDLKAENSSHTASISAFQQTMFRLEQELRFVKDQATAAEQATKTIGSKLDEVRNGTENLRRAIQDVSDEQTALEIKLSGTPITRRTKKGITNL